MPSAFPAVNVRKNNETVEIKPPPRSEAQMAANGEYEAELHASP